MNGGFPATAFGIFPHPEAEKALDVIFRNIPVPGARPVDRRRRYGPAFVRIVTGPSFLFA